MDFVRDNTDDKYIENIYTSWKNCLDNHTYIENISNAEIKFTELVEIDGIEYNYNNNIDNKKRTLFINNCNNLNIKVYEKINHIKIINCNNIFIDILDGLISGISTIHSNKITIRIKNKKIDFNELSFSHDCNVLLDLTTSENIYINTNYCYNCPVIISDINTYKKYITNLSLFANIKYFLINNIKIRCFNNLGIEITEI
jgi:hypothetical protein